MRCKGTRKPAFKQGGGRPGPGLCKGEWRDLAGMRAAGRPPCSLKRLGGQEGGGQEETHSAHTAADAAAAPAEREGGNGGGGRSEGDDRVERLELEEVNDGQAAGGIEVGDCAYTHTPTDTRFDGGRRWPGPHTQNTHINAHINRGARTRMVVGPTHRHVL